MKNLLILLIALSLTSCGLLRKKTKTTSEEETVLVENKSAQEINQDSSETENHTRITYGGANPFQTPEALAFMKALFNLSALQMPARQLDSAVNDLKSKYNDFSNAGSAMSGAKTVDSWTKEKKGSTANKISSEGKRAETKKADAHIENDSLMQSIPWYVWLIGIIAILVALAFYFGLPNRKRNIGLPRFENPPPPPPKL